jgi:hypothetical protein
MNDHQETPTCNCHNPMPEKNTGKAFTEVRKTTRSIPSVLMSILIAFFPKCPICWAVYMSMFGSLGLSRLPYMPWLLPVLLLFLGVHLLLLLRKSSTNGYIPFALSLAGAALVLSGRFFFPLQQWLMITGVIMIISGSLLNSFSGLRLPIVNLKKISFKP